MYTQTTPDFTAIKRHARTMSVQQLEYAIRDCIEAAEAASGLEAAGFHVNKTWGYYMDEASVYRQVLNKRVGKVSRQEAHARLMALVKEHGDKLDWEALLVLGIHK